MPYSQISTFQKTTDAHAGALVLNSSAVAHRITIRNIHATETVYLGGAGVTTSTGFPLLPEESITLEIGRAADIYYVHTNTTTVDLRVLIESE